jgi:hypothetical protein
MIDFESTMTEADFAKPLLDPAEERLVREVRGVDLEVEGLRSSFLSRLVGLVAGGGPGRG